jgi:Brp/Blh family beta-carotene 15,15'-monooxygenase
MIKFILLLLGFLLLWAVENFDFISANTQFAVFILSIVVLGIPHGAADLLVATKNAVETNQPFSKNKFLFVYVGRLLLFGTILILAPVAGSVLFIMFSAYHFGETDLHEFKTNTLLGKIFVISYGLLILSIILLPHFEEVLPIIELFSATKNYKEIILWVSINRFLILSVITFIFFLSTFVYFLKNNHQEKKDAGEFLVRFAGLAFILFNLPLLLGFTFYFVCWHSFLSLSNIVKYLRVDKSVSYVSIAKQILMYSSIAILGVVLSGLAGFMFLNYNSIAGYTFVGLAVLTAPHLEIMYNMYGVIRKKGIEVTN